MLAGLNPRTIATSLLIGGLIAGNVRGCVVEYRLEGRVIDLSSDLAVAERDRDLCNGVRDDLDRRNKEQEAQLAAARDRALELTPVVNRRIAAVRIATVPNVCEESAAWMTQEGRRIARAWSAQ